MDDAGFTKQVYVTRQKIVYDGTKEAEAFWQEVKPEGRLKDKTTKYQGDSQITKPVSSW